MIEINEYIKLSREDRRNHLDLSLPCKEIGGCSTHFKGILAFELNTTIPSKRNIYLCHACNNEKCCNPKHLYWGTPKDNMIDQKENAGYYTLPEKIVRKHGKEFLINLGKKLGKNHGGSNKLTEIQREKYLIVFRKYEKKYGWISSAARELNVSRTTVRRIYKNYGALV